MFAGLFERSKEASWTYQKYFDVSNNILGRKRIHIFYLNQLRFLRVYLDPEVEKSYNDFLECIKAQVNIPTESQTILFKDATLLSILGTESTRAIPITTEDCPLILWQKDESEITKSWVPMPRKFKPFPNVHDPAADTQIAKRNMILCYVKKREFEKVHRTLNLFNSVVLTINQVVVSQLMGVSKENDQAQSLIQSLQNQLDMMHGFCTSSQSFLPFMRDVGEGFGNTIETMGETFKKSRDDFEALKEEFTKLTPSLTQLLHGRLGNRSLIIQWETLARKLPVRFNVTHNITDFHIS
jgi:hypothetical protein